LNDRPGEEILTGGGNSLGHGLDTGQVVVVGGPLFVHAAVHEVLAARILQHQFSCVHVSAHLRVHGLGCVRGLRIVDNARDRPR